MTTFDSRTLLRAYAAVLTAASAVAMLGALFALLLASGSLA